MNRLILLFTIVLFSQVVFAGVIAEYKFDGNADDSVGNRDGVINGATLTTDRFGNANSAFLFDGIDDHIDFGITGGIGNAFTITAWFKSNSLDTARIVNWRPVSGDANEIRLRQLNNSSTTNLNGLIVDQSGSSSGGFKDFQGNTTLEINEWYFAAITWDGQDLNVYLNGEKDTPFSIGTNNNISMTDTPRNLVIGAVLSNNVAFDPFSGVIDDVTIHNNALSELEVRSLVVPEPYSFLLLMTGLFAIKLGRKSLFLIG